MQIDAIRPEIYLLLSEGFKKPTAAFVTEQKEVVQFLREAFAALNYDIPAHIYCQWPELAGSLSSLESDYRRSFIFPVASRVVPVESVYRRWSYDETGNVPFAAEKGFLLSDHALHMRSLYGAYGITIPEEFQATPDHLCLELEFAAFLLAKEQPGRAALFIQEHLSWVPELHQDAQRTDIPLYYRQLIELTAYFLEKELMYWSNIKF